MKIAFTRSSVAGKGNGYFLFLFQLTGQRNTVTHAKLRTEVRYHAYDMMFIRTKVKTSFAPLRKSIFLTLKLLKQLL